MKMLYLTEAVEYSILYLLAEEFIIAFGLI